MKKLFDRMGRWVSGFSQEPSALSTDVDSPERAVSASPAAASVVASTVVAAPVAPRLGLGSAVEVDRVFAEGRLRGGQEHVAARLANYLDVGRRDAGARSLPHRVVLLEAPSGEGKSRIVRGLYDALRTLEPVDRYWPEASTTSRSRDMARDRKVLGPDPRSFVWPEDAVPTFAWWHLNCDTLPHGSPADVSASLTDQLKAHSIPLGVALSRGDDAFQRRVQAVGSVLRSYVSDLAKDKLEDGAVELVSSFIPVPGVADLLGLAGASAKAARRQWSIRRALARVEDTGADVRTDASERIRVIAESIHALSSPSVPAVVAVEDAHLMSSDVRALLDRLRELGSGDASHPVLIVATAWPEASGPEYEAWRHDNLEKIEQVDVPSLRGPDLAEVIREAAPGTAPEVAGAAAALLGNPYCVRLWLTQETVAATIAEAGGEVTDELLERSQPDLDGTVDSLYEARWRELHSDVREALMRAVLIQREVPDVGTVAYVPRVVAAAVEEPLRAALLRAFRRAVHPAGWARQRSDVHVTGDVAATRRISRALRSELALGPVQRESFLSRVLESSAAFVAEAVRDTPIDPERAPRTSEGVRHEARRLQSTGELPAKPGLDLAVAYVVALDHFHAEDPAAGHSALRGPVTDAVASHPPSRLAVAATALLATLVHRDTATSPTMLTEARTLLRSVVDDPEQSLLMLTTTELDVLRALDQRLTLRLGGSAAEDLAAVVDARAQDLDKDSAPEDVARTIAELVSIAYDEYVREGRRAAVMRMRAAFQRSRDLLGLATPSTIEIGVDYLSLVGHDGDAGHYLPLVGELVDASRQVYGAHDYRTLDLERQRLRWELKGSTPTVALAERFDALVDELERLVGRYAEPTITARYQQAQAWARAGRGEHGLALIDELIAETTNTFGTDDPMTKHVRWIRKYQVEAAALTRSTADTSVFELARPGGLSWADGVRWDDDTVAELIRRYGGEG